MKYLVEETKDGQRAYNTIMVDNPKFFSVLSNELALNIIKELSKQSMCAMDVARKLKEHEQKIYYHMRKLEKIGVIRLESTEERVGAIAKIYSPVSPIISFKLFEGDTVTDMKTKVASLKFLHPFIIENKFNALVVVGSPDPHGKYKSSASDGYVGINIGSFFGQFVVEMKEPVYKLDTQVTEADLKKNLILIGGPKNNIITERINEKLPIYFDYSEETFDWELVSKISKNVYQDKYVGIVARIPSPFAKGKEIIVFAGKGFSGSKAAVLAFTQHLKEVAKGNSFKPQIMSRVVKGIDVDSDGIVDEVEFIE